MNILERARASGKCPPSLFCEEPKEDGFEAAIAKVLDANGKILLLLIGLSVLSDLTFRRLQNCACLQERR